METERLILRPYCEADFEDYFAYSMEPELQKMMGEDIHSRSEAEETFSWMMKNREFLAIVPKNLGRPIGHLCIHPVLESLLDDPHFKNLTGCSLSFAIAAPYRRMGYASEALTAWISEQFSSGKLDYIDCEHAPFNLASGALQKKLGFRFDHQEPFYGETLIVNILRKEDWMRVHMDTITLTRPGAQLADEIWSYRQEMLDAGSSMDGTNGLNNAQSAEAWIARTVDFQKPQTTPPGLVPSDTYLAVRPQDGRVVGMIDLRHYIEGTPLETWGGHIGYSVRPSERRKGYATAMLGLCLEKSRELGLKKVLVTCHDGNVGSEKVIRANGGVYDSSVSVDGEMVKRFWISLEK